MSNRSLNSQTPTSEFARVYIQDPSLTSLTSASSAAFKLSPETSASDVVALVNKKFSKMSTRNLFGTSSSSSSRKSAAAGEEGDADGGRGGGGQEVRSVV